MAGRWNLTLLRYPPVIPLATIMTNTQDFSASVATAPGLPTAGKSKRRRRILLAFFVTSFMTTPWSATPSSAEAPPSTGWEAIHRKMQSLLGVKKKHHSSCDGACDSLGETWISQPPAGMPMIQAQPLPPRLPVVSPVQEPPRSYKMDQTVLPDSSDAGPRSLEMSETPPGPPPTPDPIPFEPPALEAEPNIVEPQAEEMEVKPFDEIQSSEARSLNDSSDDFEARDSSRRPPTPSTAPLEPSPDPVDPLDLDSTPEPTPPIEVPPQVQAPTEVLAPAEAPAQTEIPVQPEFEAPTETEMQAPEPVDPLEAFLAEPPANSKPTELSPLEVNPGEPAEALPAPSEPMPSIFGDSDAIDPFATDPMPEALEAAPTTDSNADLFSDPPDVPNEDAPLFADPMPTPDPQPDASFDDPFGDAFNQPGPNDPVEPDPAQAPAIPQPMMPSDTDDLDELFGTPTEQAKEQANPSDIQTDLDSLFNDIPGADALEPPKDKKSNDDLLDSLFNNIPRRFNEQARSMPVNGMRMTAPVIKPIARNQSKSSKSIRQATHYKAKPQMASDQDQWSARPSNR
ncbi:MAG: hypothetical protein AAF664_07050 [Planctomycetota bacterium]